MHPLPDTSNALLDQPVQAIVEVGGIYFRSIMLKRAGEVVPQHVHDHPHATLVGSGRARGWANGQWIGDRGPGEAFGISAGKEHVFLALEANTLLVCAHDVASALRVKEKEA